MKPVLAALTSLSIALMPLAQASAVQTDERAMTAAERLQKTMNEVPPAELKVLAEQEAKSIAMFKKAVNETQVALDGKKEVQGLYSVSLNVKYAAVTVSGISGIVALGSGFGTSIGTIFNKNYRAAVVKNVKESPFFKIRQNINTQLMDGDALKNWDYKYSRGASRWFKYSILSTVASAFVASNALSETASFNQDQIGQLQSALTSLSNDLAQHEAYHKFLLQQLALREQAR
jgi:hypothetical protein